MLEGELEREEAELLAEILRQPEALENGTNAMADYRAMIDTQRAKRDDTSEDALLAARDSYRKKKSL